MADQSPSIAVSQAAVERAIDTDDNLHDFLFKMVNINEQGVFFDPNCPVCKSIKRRAAEEEWIKGRNAEDVAKVIKEGGETISIPYVKNHMEYHVDQSQVEIRKREYINKIMSVNDQQLSTLKRIEFAMTAIDDRMVSINAMDDPLETISKLEKMKSDAICSLSSSLQKLAQLRATLLGELEDSGEVFVIRKDDMQQVFVDVLNHFSTEEAKDIVNMMLTKMMEVRRVR
jgi:Cdc6-like AAA superfamily ATPase